VYLRYGIPCVNIETLHDYFLEEVPPLVYAAPGGCTWRSTARRPAAPGVEEPLLGELAKALGVSRRTISK
jgi:putative transcriptional regulator